MNISTEQWSQALRTILSKAATESAFRAECLANPAAAVQEATGLVAPGGVRFSETGDPSAIQLPPFTTDPDEITDLEILGNVAGGGAWGYVSIGDNTNECEA